MSQHLADTEGRQSAVLLEYVYEKKVMLIFSAIIAASATMS